ncbi:tetratricopeptide repeat protein [Caballeronia sp. dw_19]|uniref:tetratricopeptide repeat protein n=1 Tax=Caballeronia sp. dw_19 TaxID=2719791 RepID=UPI001BD52B3B|nr:tetratricopeptide repeat protein [Caballeronia sp. dw_19]
MRRSWTHIAFGLVALGCAAVVADDGLRMKHAEDVRQAVSEAGVITSVPSHLADLPEARLARAMALSKAGAYADAQKLYEAQIQDDAGSDLAQAALFNLGNMYLRQATGEGNPGPVKSLPLLEQAKQRYRQLLRVTPGDWDARYNLERALWRAPEETESADEPDVKEQHDVKLRGAQAEDLP